MAIPYNSPVPYDTPEFTYDGESTVDTTVTAQCIFVRERKPSWFVLDDKVTVK